ncbi:Leucine-rich repeat 2, partial [Arabidopsis suecica]
MDRISNLPTEIICHIGSFLSAKEAAFTTVLSKRWHNLFTIVPDLHFDGSVKDGETFTDFVDRVMALPASSRVNKFSLKWWFDEDTDQPARYDLINRCLRNVLKRGVVDLHLWVNGKQGYSLPFEVFTCETVAKLKLGSGFVIDFLPKYAFLPALKTLVLDSIRFFDFGRCAFNTLLSASPVLEELGIDGVEWERWKWSRTVSSPTLQRLSIRRKEWYLYEDDSGYESFDPRGIAYNIESISLDTPGLTYLDYSDYVPKEYLIVNLNSLVEAKLNLSVEEDGLWNNGHADNFNPMNLINGVKNVEIMDLTADTMEMFSVFGEAIPVFENLFHVSLSLSNYCWFALPLLLKKSPHLKTLVLEHSLHYASLTDREEWGLVCQCVSKYSFLLTCHVEVLKINEYWGTLEELEQIKHFLEKLSCLKLVKIRAQVKVDKQVQVMADLLMLPRASTKCKIQVKFS